MVGRASACALVFAALLLAPPPAAAQELHSELQGVWKAEVLEIVEGREEELPWNGVKVTVQEVRAELLDGERKGETVTFKNDYIPLEPGDRFFLNYMVTIDGDELYSVRDVDRMPQLLVFVALFAAVILAFGGRQGVRSLLSLAGSLVVVMYVLLPALLGGYSPVATSTAVASLILFVAIFFTHGFNRHSLIAFSGTVLSVALTGLLAYVAVATTGLTGFGTDESVYLNLNTEGRLNFSGLLLGGIIIGVLGVLDDIAVTQVAVVRELLRADGRLGPRELYKRAISVGREHVSALVNTLVLAYAGAALPLLMLVSLSGSTAAQVLNQEVFAAEVIRTAVGSIGLVLTVPLTTLLAALWLTRIPPEKGGKSKFSGHAHVHRERE